MLCQGSPGYHSSDFTMVVATGVNIIMEQVKGKQDTVEYVCALLSLETRNYVPPRDYLPSFEWPQSSVNNDPVSEIWRRKLCEWCYEVVDHFGFDREVVSIALSYLDRSVSIRTNQIGPSITKREFQLFAVTCLYIAIKVHGETDASLVARQKMRIDAFVQLSRGFFQVDVIEEKERSILADLNWHINPPTSLKFIATFLRLCPRWQQHFRDCNQVNVLGAVYDVARYLTELSVCVSRFSFDFKASVVGYAAILCAIDSLQNTMPLPYSVCSVFLNNIADACDLVPSDPQVRQACSMLKDLCPGLFEGEDFPPEFFPERNTIVASISLGDGGKVSPICVSATHHELEIIERSRKKRNRSSLDGWKGLNHSN